MKHPLTRRLVMYFSVTLLLFSMLIGTVFAFLFTRYTREMQEEALQERAGSLAAALPMLEALQPTDGGERAEDGREGLPAAGEREGYGRRDCWHGWGMRGMRHGGPPSFRAEEALPPEMGEHQWCRRRVSGGEDSRGGADAHLMGPVREQAAALRRLGDLAQGSVWLVDGESRTISYYGTSDETEISELPEGAEAVLAQALEGTGSVSEAFTPLLGMASVTAAAPVRDETGAVLGAVLVHRPLSELQEVGRHGIHMLAVSVGLGFLLASLLALLLARRFIGPLYRMQETARAFADGHFGERTGVEQRDEIGELAVSIDRLGKRLGEAEAERAAMQQQRQDFLSAVSHELRTPLTVLRGTWELLLSGLVRDEEKKRGYERQILANLEALDRLVGDLLELARLRNAGFRVEMQPLELGEVCRDALRSARPLAEEKQVELTAELPEALPVQGDFGRLRQLFLILLDNAIKFSPEGGEVKIRSRLRGAGWLVEVEDRGCGIAPEEIPHVFERFHTNKEGNPGGTGLGLAIAAEIARRHGCSLSCESFLGEGTKFILKK